MSLRGRLDKLEPAIIGAWQAEWDEFYDRAFAPIPDDVRRVRLDSPHLPTTEEQGKEADALVIALMEAYSLDTDAWSAW